MFEIVLQRIKTIWKKWQVIHYSPGFKHYDRENSSSRNTSSSAGSNSLLNLTLQELGTLKRDWAISSRIYPESKQPLPWTRDILLPPGTRNSLISLRTYAYEWRRECSRHRIAEASLIPERCNRQISSNFLGQRYTSIIVIYTTLETKEKLSRRFLILLCCTN